MLLYLWHAKLYDESPEQHDSIDARQLKFQGRAEVCSIGHESVEPRNAWPRQHHAFYLCALPVAKHTQPWQCISGLPALRLCKVLCKRGQAG